MIAVIQRVSEANVRIDGVIKSGIKQGLCVLLSISQSDKIEDAEWLSNKVASIRIFEDHEGKMNRSLKEINGELLVISQFTLHASTKKGNRPSFLEAARPEIAIPLYHKFILLCEVELDISIKTGEFGAHMEVSLINDGPITIIIDSKNKK